MRKQLLFIGDSLTEWGNWKELFPDFEIENRGIAGEKTADILFRMKSFPKMKPHKVFYMAGINDLGDSLPVTAIVENYKNSVQLMVQNWGAANCFILSVLPVDYPSFTHTSIYIENIKLLNNNLQQIALNYNITFIDMTIDFNDLHENLNTKFTYDGLHLNSTGYQVWKEKIESFIYK